MAAKEKFVIVSDCRIEGEIFTKGSLIELDWEDKSEAKTIALLNRSGRIAQATAENIKSIRAAD
jgi:hypothetical protein